MEERLEYVGECRLNIHYESNSGVQGYVFPSILGFCEELELCMHSFVGCDLLGGNKQLESTGVLLDIYLYRQHSGSWNTPLMRITKGVKWPQSILVANCSA